MAADFETSSVVPVMVSTRRLEGTLVAPERTKDVPNHLTETRIFGKAKANTVLQVSPSIVLFEGCKIGKTHQRTIRILNSSMLNQPMHIIPPKTSSFGIKYSKKQSTLIPGLSLSVVIEFKPTEWKYCYDCIRLHCQGEQNMLIPIHAYPVLNTSHFPRFVTMDPTPIGKSQTKTLVLKSDLPVSFEYKLSYLQSNPNYSINKMKGTVPANDEVGIDVVFSPTEYNTSIMELKLEASQYNFTPKTCTFTGSSTPGLALELRSPTPTKHSVREPLLKPSKHKNLTRLVSNKGSNSTIPSKPDMQEVYYEGILFPSNLDAPSAVGKVLLQVPGKMKASQIRKVISQSSALSLKDKESSRSAGMDSRQVKQAAFLQEVETVAKEERVNHLRWATRLGELPIADEKKDTIYRFREVAKNLYQQLCGIIIPEVECARTKPVLKYCKTRRRASEYAEPQHPSPTFDPYSNNPFVRRYMARRRFVQAGRKMIIRLRCQERLEKLQRVASHLKAGKSLRTSLADIYEKKVSISSLAPLLPSSPAHISLLSFPKYTGHVPSNVGGIPQRISKNSVGIQSSPLVNVEKEIPLLDLEVPQQSELLGYSVAFFPTLGSYITPGMPRELWTGAEDEFQNLGHIPGVDAAFFTGHEIVSAQESQVFPSIEPSVISASDLALQAASSEISDRSSAKMVQTNAADVADSEVLGAIVDSNYDGQDNADGMEAAVVIPPALLQTSDIHLTHILNPAPKVTSYLPPLPYSEATLDHSLLPLPPYSTAKHPIVKPDPIEILPVLMKWKEFPSPWLTSSETEKKLALLWKPYQSDICNTDLLPSQDAHLTLLSGIQPDDYVKTKSLQVLTVPTMKTVKAQFFVPTESAGLPEVSSTESISKDEKHSMKPQASVLLQEAQNELEKHRTEQYNQLGRAVSKKLQGFLKLLDGSSAVDAD